MCGADIIKFVSISFEHRRKVVRTQTRIEVGLDKSFKTVGNGVCKKKLFPVLFDRVNYRIFQRDRPIQESEGAVRLVVISMTRRDNLSCVPVRLATDECPR